MIISRGVVGSRGGPVEFGLVCSGGWDLDLDGFAVEEESVRCRLPADEVLGALDAGMQLDGPHRADPIGVECRSDQTEVGAARVGNQIV